MCVSNERVHVRPRRLLFKLFIQQIHFECLFPSRHWDPVYQQVRGFLYLQKYPRCTLSPQHHCHQQSPSVQIPRPHPWVPTPTSLGQGHSPGPTEPSLQCNTCTSPYRPKLCLSVSLSASPDPSPPLTPQAPSPSWSHDLLDVHGNLLLFPDSSMSHLF